MAYNVAACKHIPTITMLPILYHNNSALTTKSCSTANYDILVIPSLLLNECASVEIYFYQCLYYNVA